MEDSLWEFVERQSREISSNTARQCYMNNARVEASITEDD